MPGTGREKRDDPVLAPITKEARVQDNHSVQVLEDEEQFGTDN